MLSLTHDSISDQVGVSDVVGPAVDLQTYKNLAYFLLSFPLGVMYSFVLGVGFLFGIGLSIVVVGVGVLLAMVFVIRALTEFERWLTCRLLAVSLDPPAESSTGESLGATVRASLGDETTWRGLGFLTLKLWFGIVGVFLLFAFATVVSLVSAVVRLPHTIEFGEVNGDPVIWTVETLPEAALAMLLGLVSGLFLLHLTNGFASVTHRITTALL
jgi:hypothetical protein